MTWAGRVSHLGFRPTRLRHLKVETSKAVGGRSSGHPAARTGGRGRRAGPPASRKPAVAQAMPTVWAARYPAPSATGASVMVPAAARYRSSCALGLRGGLRRAYGCRA